VSQPRTRKEVWTRGHFVSTVGRDEEVIREYIRNQKNEDARLEQLSMWK
jgi:putative transposase